MIDVVYDVIPMRDSVDTLGSPCKRIYYFMQLQDVQAAAVLLVIGRPSVVTVCQDHRQILRQDARKRERRTRATLRTLQHRHSYSLTVGVGMKHVEREPLPAFLQASVREAPEASDFSLP